jgi:peptide deformylase
MVKIVQKGEKVLRQKAKEVDLKNIADKKIKAILTKMTKALWASPNGVAIAAPQIGESLRVFLIEASVFDKEGFTDEEKKKKRQPMVFINPKITRVSKKKVPMPEGCLSVDKVFGNVERSDKLTIESYDEHGKKKTRNVSGFLAQIVQHEFDHLEGVLFVDKATQLKKVEDDKK